MSYDLFVTLSAGETKDALYPPPLPYHPMDERTD